MVQLSLHPRSLQVKLLLWAGLLLVLVTGILIAYTSVIIQDAALADAQKQLLADTGRSAASIEYTLNEGMEMTRTLSDAFAGVKEQNIPISRDMANAMLKQDLSTHTSAIGASTGWEPDAFDGNDAAYAGKTGHDATGRFIPYWSRGEDGQVRLEPLVDYDTPGAGDYYLVPAKTKKPALVEPYVYPVQGKDVFMTTVVSPVLVKGDFLGIVTADVPIPYMQKIADALQTKSQGGRMIIVSNQGIVTGYTGRPELVSKPLSDVSTEISLNLDEIRSHAGTVIRQADRIDAIMPITVTGTDTPWYLITSTPNSILYEQAIQTTTNQIIIGIVLILLGLIGLYFVIRRFVSPIRQISVEAFRLAKGDLAHTVSYTGNDELGDLTHAFSLLIESQIRKIHMAKAIASGEMNAENFHADDEDQLGRAMVDMSRVISDLVHDVQSLLTGAQEGNLTSRADSTAYQGEYRTIIDGFNQTLDTVTIPVREAMHLAGNYASGDFSARFNPDIPVTGEFLTFRSSLDQVGEEFGNRISQVVADIRIQLEALVQSVDEVNASVQEAAQNGRQIALNSSDISTNAIQSREEIKQILAAIERLTKGITLVSGQVTRVHSITAETGTLSRDGNLLAAKAQDGMHQILHSHEETSEVIHEINDRMQDITAIVDIITSISDQTSLLALNAAIEAARAGDAGMGFAVVAGEVKELAQESQKSANRISDIIGNLQKMAGRITLSTERSTSDVRSGADSVSDMVGVFSKISDQIREVESLLLEVTQATTGQTGAVDQVHSIVQVLDTNVETNTNQSMSTAALTEESTVALDEIAASVSEAAASVEAISRAILRISSSG